MLNAGFHWAGRAVAQNLAQQMQQAANQTQNSQAKSSMQQAAQAFVRSQLIGPSARFNALPITSASTPRDIFHSVLLRDVRNLHRTDEYLPNHSAFAKMVDAFVKAQRVYVVGFRGLSSLASLSAFLLDMAGFDPAPITHGDAFGFQAASRMRRGDVLLAFAFVRYTKATKELVEMANRLDAPTIVICDSVMAPAARKASFVLQAAVDSSSFHNSYTAAVSCINALIVALSFKCRARVARRLREVDESLPTQEFDMDESAWGSDLIRPDRQRDWLLGQTLIFRRARTLPVPAAIQRNAATPPPAASSPGTPPSASGKRPVPHARPRA